MDMYGVTSGFLHHSTPTPPVYPLPAWGACVRNDRAVSTVACATIGKGQRLTRVHCCVCEWLHSASIQVAYKLTRQVRPRTGVGSSVCAQARPPIDRALEGHSDSNPP
jgi:hypothetical protein